MSDVQVHRIKGKMFAKKRYQEKAQMKKTLAMHEESSSRRKVDDDVQDYAVPAYLLDRGATTQAKVLSNIVKQKKKEKAGKWDVPLPNIRIQRDAVSPPEDADTSEFGTRRLTSHVLQLQGTSRSSVNSEAHTECLLMEHVLPVAITSSPSHYGTIKRKPLKKTNT
ncbi:ribosome biogenesis protein [Artemisia annua]|uniref:Ribosome biogenesis protein n=1 Tax=Artemisia annua TaxID=35608 RepID=A0A2U1KP10_ARTAN|nr:ribosome biogenesis protein [Artemisia annua]